MDHSGATVATEDGHFKAVHPFARRRNPPTGDGPARSMGAERSRSETSVVNAETPDDHRALILRLARDRDRTAFAALFGHFGPRVKAYLMRSGSDAESAEELVQEAMLTVWRRAESFDPAQASVATWIFTIARNKRIDAYRRKNRPELDAEDPALMPQPEAQPDDTVMQGQTADAIRAAVAELPEEQAAMLKMAFYEDKAHSEIAKETGLPLGTVKSRLRLAIGRMRKHLEEFEG